MQANMHQAKSQLSQLVDLALEGEEVIIAKSGKPTVRLVPYVPTIQRQCGRYKGQIELSDKFDADVINSIDLAIIDFGGK
jgi:prevent-host-death family protein